MSLLVVGSVGYDTIITPDTTGKDLLGGSATYFSISAGYYTPVTLVGVVGEDFSAEDEALLRRRGVDVRGLERAAGRTFRWTGEYSSEDVNQRETLEVQLNVSDGFDPVLSPEHRRSEYLFLANMQPELQLRTLAQIESRPRLIAADTIAIWIETQREQLTEVLKSVDLVFMDEGEVRAFSGVFNLVRAARSILELGPSVVVAKRGEHGVLMVQRDRVFAAPAFPLDSAVDPTGAGDSFAGGFMGYLAETGDLSWENLRRAAVVGTVMGSFTVQALSVGRLASLTRGDAVERLRGYRELTSFEGLGAAEDLPWREKVGVGCG